MPSGLRHGRSNDRKHALARHQTHFRPLLALNEAAGSLPRVFGLSRQCFEGCLEPKRSKPAHHKRPVIIHASRTKTKKRTCCCRSAFLMPPVGVEPTYSGFSVQRLNQLSYSGVGSGKLGQTRPYGNGCTTEKSLFAHKSESRSSCPRRPPTKRFAFQPGRPRIFRISRKRQGSSLDSEHPHTTFDDNM